jgi:hypothetical protein
MDRKRAIRPASLVLAGLLLLTVSTPVAALEPPPNNDFDDATAITALPFSDEVNTREATEADDDPDCFGAGPTVWYAVTLPEDTFVEVNTFGSNYDTTLSAYVGERGDLDQIACNDDAAGTLQSRIRFFAAADQTVFVMVGAFASGPGGDLVLTALETDPFVPLEIDLVVEKAQKLFPVEIKSGKTITNDFFKGLKFWQKISGDPGGAVIYAGDEVQRRSNQIEIYPWDRIAEAGERL